jgi:uncharacterized protein YqgC (DUF456 family)
LKTVALVLSIILFITGLLGTVLPVLPGAILIYGGMLLYGLLTGFQTLNAQFFILQGLLLILTFFIDFLASAVGTKRFGGSKQAAWGAIIGTLLGFVLLGPLGIVVGPFLGTVVTELLQRKELEKAIHIGFGTLIGILGGTILKLCIELIMIIYFFMQI